MNFKELLSVTLILFSVIDIVGAIPIIIELRRKNGSLHARRATIVAGGIMFIFLFLGDSILKLFGVDFQSFALAGGIILFIIGMEMVLDRQFFKSGETDYKTASIVPLAFPIIAGTGTMTTILSLRAQYALESIIVSILINLVLVFLVVKNSFRIENLLGQAGINIVRKVFGTVLLAIALKIFISQFNVMESNLNKSVERIEKTVKNIEDIHKKNMNHSFNVKPADSSR